MILVLDASASIDILLNKGNYQIYKKKIAHADTVIAPEIYISEMANIAWKYKRTQNETTADLFKKV